MIAVRSYGDRVVAAVEICGRPPVSRDRYGPENNAAVRACSRETEHHRRIVLACEFGQTQGRTRSGTFGSLLCGPDGRWYDSRCVLGGVDDLGVDERVADGD